MTFHEFIESTYVSTNIECQAQYSVYKEARVQAAQGLIQAQRRIWRTWNYLSLLWAFALTKAHLRDEPRDAKDLVKEIQEKRQKEAEANAKASQAEAVESKKKKLKAVSDDLPKSS